jgi:hypothetical protein
MNGLGLGGTAGVESPAVFLYKRKKVKGRMTVKSSIFALFAGLKTGENPAHE